MRKRSALHPMKLETQMKMRTVLELRVTGASYSFIADKVGCSQPYVGNLLRRGLDQLKNETMDAAERLRNLEILRLDAMLASLWEKRAETKVAEVLLKISERRSKLMGLDAPIKLQPELPGGDMPFDTPATREEAEERIAELLALARPQPLLLEGDVEDDDPDYIDAEVPAEAPEVVVEEPAVEEVVTVAEEKIRELELPELYPEELVVLDPPPVVPVIELRKSSFKIPCF